MAADDGEPWGKPGMETLGSLGEPDLEGVKGGVSACFELVW